MTPCGICRRSDASPQWPRSSQSCGLATHHAEPHSTGSNATQSRHQGAPANRFHIRPLSGTSALTGAAPRPGATARARAGDSVSPPGAGRRTYRSAAVPRPLALGLATHGSEQAGNLCSRRSISALPSSGRTTRIQVPGYAPIPPTISPSQLAAISVHSINLKRKPPTENQYVSTWKRAFFCSSGRSASQSMPWLRQMSAKASTTPPSMPLRPQT